MKLSGICKIYATDPNGKVITTTKNNAIMLPARNILVDMLGGINTQEMTLNDILRIFYIKLMDNTSTHLLFDAANSVTSSANTYIDLTIPTSTVSGNNITTSVSTTYAATSTGVATVSFQIVFSPGTFSTAGSGIQTLEKIQMTAKSTNDALSADRVFSEIDFSGVSIDTLNTYTVIYTYTINP